MLAACGGGGGSDDVAGGGNEPAPPAPPSGTTHTLTVQVQGLPEGAALPIRYGDLSESLSASNDRLAIQASGTTRIALGKLELTTEQPYLVQCAFAEPLAGTLQSDGSLQASFSTDATQTVECSQKIALVLQQRHVVAPANKGSGLNVLTANLDGLQAQWLSPPLMVNKNTINNRVSALMNNELYVSASEDDINSPTGVELRATDGVTARLVKDINTAVNAGVGAGSDPGSLVALGNKLYFSAEAGPGGTTLWVSDGTEAGTQQVLLQGNAFINPEGLTVAGDKLFFRSQAKVYAIDKSGTVTDLGLTQTAGSFSVVGDRIFLTDDTGSQWFSDGTVAGTREFQAAWFNSAPIEFNGELYFSGAATSGETAKLHAIKPDGTGFRLVKDVIRVSPRFVLGDKLLLTVNQRGVTGSEWWVSDGTEAGTQIIKDAIPGPGGLAPEKIFSLGERLVFVTKEGEAGSQAPYYIWTTDGTAEGTKRLSAEGVEAFATKNIFKGWTQVGPGHAVFQIHEGGLNSNVAKLWITDGTPEGTKPLLDKNGQQLEAYSPGTQYAL
ncbi:hypothetical protein [Lampropedia cohaerens]|nr:hypothetical protein [Lampropedia cohaerens]